MTALQSGILWWLSVALAFGLGVMFHALCCQGRDVSHRVKALEAERLARKTRRELTRRARASEAARLNFLDAQPGGSGDRHHRAGRGPRSPFLH